MWQLDLPSFATHPSFRRGALHGSPQLWFLVLGFRRKSPVAEYHPCGLTGAHHRCHEFGQASLFCLRLSGYRMLERRGLHSSYIRYIPLVDSANFESKTEIGPFGGASWCVLPSDSMPNPISASLSFPCRAGLPPVQLLWLLRPKLRVALAPASLTQVAVEPLLAAERARRRRERHLSWWVPVGSSQRSDRGSCRHLVREGPCLGSAGLMGRLGRIPWDPRRVPPPPGAI